MFKVGGKYMFSMRKYTNRMGKGCKHDSWAKSLVGIPFVVTQEMLDGYTHRNVCSMCDVKPPNVSVYKGFGVDFSWCIPIK